MGGKGGKWGFCETQHAKGLPPQTLQGMDAAWGWCRNCNPGLPQCSQEQTNPNQDFGVLADVSYQDRGESSWEGIPTWKAARLGSPLHTLTVPEPPADTNTSSTGQGDPSSPCWRFQLRTTGMGLQLVWVCSLGFALWDVLMASRTYLEAHKHSSTLNITLWFSPGVLLNTFFKSKEKTPSILPNLWVSTQFGPDTKK